MDGHGFVPVGKNSWYHPELKLMAADVKPDNFIQLGKNSLMAVDVILRPFQGRTDMESMRLHDVVRQRAVEYAKAIQLQKANAPHLPASPSASTRTMVQPEPAKPPPSNPPDTPPEKNLQAAPLTRRKIQGRPGLEHLPDQVEATEGQRYGLLRSAVARYGSRFPALQGRFRKGMTQGRSGLETQFRDASGCITPYSLHGAHIAVDEGKLAADLRGLSPRQVAYHVEHAQGCVLKMSRGALRQSGASGQGTSAVPVSTVILAKRSDAALRPRARNPEGGNREAR